MEMFRYRCPVCGMIYEVPSYWMSFTPDETTEFPHMKPGSGDVCENTELEHIED